MDDSGFMIAGGWALAGFKDFFEAISLLQHQDRVDRNEIKINPEPPTKKFIIYGYYLLLTDSQQLEECIMGEKLTRVDFRKYIYEGLLIVFSVLFALFINSMAEGVKRTNEKQIAYENIKREINRNALIIEEWKLFHNEVEERINELVNGKNDSLKAEFQNYGYLNLGVLTNGKSLINANISNTAWETAKSTGIISEFDFETVQNLTEVYTLQNYITEKTLANIVDLLFSPEANRLENLESTLIQLQLRFQELTGQEYLLGEIYKEVTKSS